MVLGAGEEKQKQSHKQLYNVNMIHLKKCCSHQDTRDPVSALSQRKWSGNSQVIPVSQWEGNMDVQQHSCKFPLLCHLPHSPEPQNISSPSPRSHWSPYFYLFSISHLPSFFPTSTFPHSLPTSYLKVGKWNEKTSTLSSSWQGKSQDLPMIQVFISHRRKERGFNVSVWWEDLINLVKYHFIYTYI